MQLFVNLTSFILHSIVTIGWNEFWISINMVLYSLIQKNGYTFATVYCSKCVSVFLNQTLVYYSRYFCATTYSTNCNWKKNVLWKRRGMNISILLQILFRFIVNHFYRQQRILASSHHTTMGCNSSWNKIKVFYLHRLCFSQGISLISLLNCFLKPNYFKKQSSSSSFFLT